MTDQDITDLESDLIRAIDRVHEIEVAELDRRVADPFAHAVSLENARATVDDLREELAAALAEEIGGGDDDAESTESSGEEG